MGELKPHPAKSTAEMAEDAKHWWDEAQKVVSTQQSWRQHCEEMADLWKAVHSLKEMQEQLQKKVQEILKKLEGTGPPKPGGSVEDPHDRG